MGPPPRTESLVTAIIVIYFSRADTDAGGAIAMLPLACEHRILLHPVEHVRQLSTARNQAACPGDWHHPPVSPWWTLTAVGHVGLQQQGVCACSRLVLLAIISSHTGICHTFQCLKQLCAALPHTSVLLR